MRLVIRKYLRLSLALAVLLLAGVTALSIVIYRERESSHGATRVTQGACAAVVEFEGRRYYGSKLQSNDSFQRGEQLGIGEIPACIDHIVTELASDGTTVETHKEGFDAEPTKVFSIVGLKPINAVVIENREGIIYISHSLSDRARDSECRDARSASELFRCMEILS